MSPSAYPASPSQLSYCRFASFALLAAFAAAVSRTDAQSPTYCPATPPVRRIVLSIPDRKLALLENDRVVKVYDVAVGAPVSPSPDGEYQIAQRLENLAYDHPGIVIGPSANNPLGPRWIGIRVEGFAIHGTSRPESIDKNASHGCLGLRNRDMGDLFARVKAEDRLSIIAERNEDVARLFGINPDSAHSTPSLVAKNKRPAAPETDSQGER